MSREYGQTRLKVEGMVCSGCETIIKNQLKRFDGVIEIEANYKNAIVYVIYNETKINKYEIIKAIRDLDYKITDNNAEEECISSNGKSIKKSKYNIKQLLGIVIIIVALYFIINSTVGFNFIPQINQSMGYGLLFVAGLLTSLHCIAMCGGINISQCASYQIDDTKSPLKPSMLYNVGRVFSYTIIGGVVGGLGSVVNFSGEANGIVAIFAGVFMLLMGLNMLNIFPQLKKFNVRMPKFFGKKINNSLNNRGPFYIGLLNGLMPCGPLQSMQLYALGTGSILNGALSMFFFSIGTIPLMFGLGVASSLISNKLSHKIMKLGATLVMILGLIMINRGLSLSGISIAGVTKSPSNIAVLNDNIQVVTTKMESGSYTPIVVQKDIPVKWTIIADESDLNGCNNPVTIPKYNIEKTLVPGENIIEFTPQEEGDIAYTCWMGMISSNIKVVENLEK